MRSDVIATEAGLQWTDFIELSKPRITLMVVLTTLIGFLLTTTAPLDVALLIHALVGTAMVASGASALNQVLERRTDALMQRTAQRPIPSGRLDVSTALLFGVGISVVGMAYLALAVNLLTATLGALTLAAYVFVYTPMKRRSSLATLVGAVPGAVPPMMGCAAATGILGLEAWSLFGILFLWQMPHFLAIAWLYRQDYERGGFPLLTSGPNAGPRTARQMILYTAALLPVSVMPTVVGLASWPYLASALALGLIYLYYCIGFAKSQGPRSARQLLLYSVVYLPVLLIFLVLDHALLM